MELLLNTPATMRPTTATRAIAPVLVATDGQTQSDAAIAMGKLLAGSGDRMRVVSVLKPVTVMPEAYLLASVDIEEARRKELERDIGLQVARTLSEKTPIEYKEGDPATEITELAKRIDACMIVSGLGRHRVSDRLFGDETAMRLMRMSSVPVFAAVNGAKRLPRRIIVAMDFSETSVRAAQLAIDLAARDAKIFLVHVAPRDRVLNDWSNSYKESAAAALAKARARLDIPAQLEVEEDVLQGDPATELLALASSLNADLIAAGSHGHGFFARMIVGSVTTRLVRCATCSILAVPHLVVPRRTDASDVAGLRALPQNEWSALLDEFSRRNFGRLGVLEVDDPEIGAQKHVIDFPFLGATFDRYDQRVELMFGSTEQSDRHLTRSISDARAIDVLQVEPGRDAVIRITHGTGQTLLTFAP